MNLHEIQDADEARAVRIQLGFRKLYRNGIVRPNRDFHPTAAYPFKYKITPTANFWGYFSPGDANYWEVYER